MPCIEPAAVDAVFSSHFAVLQAGASSNFYNAILIPAFVDADPEQVADDIMEHRCRDSIGTTAVFQGDSNDRQRGAFRTAWLRGLYIAAYSLPPATVKGQIKVVK